jgi:predicted DNA-binding antitoxin AbrB/MazE fold protein
MMTRTVEAVYENGVFKPLEPIELPEGQRVEVTIPYIFRPITEEEVEERLRETQQLFEGLTEEEIAKVEASVLERCNRRDGSE